MPSFQLQPQIAAHSITQHPTQPHLWVVGASQHFGLAGSGRVYSVLNNPQQQAINFATGCVLPEAVFGACFPDPTSPDVVAVACGDGVKCLLMNTVNLQLGQLQQPPILPASPIQQHQTECTAVKACSTPKMALPGRFLSCGFDGTVRVFQLGQGGQLHLAANLAQVPGFSLTPLAPKVFDAAPHPGDPNIVATAFSDGLWRVFDLRISTPAPRSQVQPQQTCAGMVACGGHPQLNGIVNSVDWSHFDPAFLCIGTAAGFVDIFDMRKHSSNAGQQQQQGAAVPPVMQLRGGHRASVRRARFSPHSRNMILSCGFDFSVCLWDTDRPLPTPQQQQLQLQQPPFLAHRYEHHREPVHDVAWDLHMPGCVMSCSWDGLVVNWQLGTAPSFSPPQMLPQWPEPQRAMGAPRLMMKL